MEDKNILLLLVIASLMVVDLTRAKRILQDDGVRELQQYEVVKDLQISQNDVGLSRRKTMVYRKEGIQKSGYSNIHNNIIGSNTFPIKHDLPARMVGHHQYVPYHTYRAKTTSGYPTRIPGQFGKTADPDATRNLTQLIRSQGYPVETYVVQTRDGFLLDLHRIPHGRDGNTDTNTDRYTGGNNSDQLWQSNWRKLQNNKSNTEPRPAVFLQHGYLSSACDFVMNFANDSLAFVLADAGYDVWLGNSRGNTYSMRHTDLNKNDTKFWDFSFDEMAQYDTPAFIDFILLKTSQPSLYYIGHSQGTVIAFALLSQQPEYQKKIRLFVGLAPIMSLANMKSPMKYLAKMNESLIYRLLGHNECFLHTNKTDQMANTMCADPYTRWLCYDMLFLTNGPDLSNLNQTRLPVYMSHTPAGTSVKNVVHYAQMIREKRFAKFDYGTKSENIKRYGQPIPPAYNVSSIRVPALLFTASNDWLADPRDVSILESTLPNIQDKYNYPSWNHMDFVLGMDAAQVCYSQILKRLPDF